MVPRTHRVSSAALIPRDGHRRPSPPADPVFHPTASRVLPATALADWRQTLRDARRTLVTTNGCFDLLHAGHVAFLEAARALGDVLLVGLNADESVRQLKGAHRPLQPAADRARILAALACVDAVCIFPEVRADRFLATVRPDIYAKAGDYTLESLDPGERAVLESAGARIVFLPYLDGRSTSRIAALLSAH